MKNDNEILIRVNSTHTMGFHKEDKEVGILKWEDGILEFTGNAKKSAKVLFDFLKPYVDSYIIEEMEKRDKK